MTVTVPAENKKIEIEKKDLESKKLAFQNEKNGLI